MTSSIQIIRDQIFDQIESSFVQGVHHGTYPTGETILMNGSRVDPYITVNFGDIRQQGSRNMASVRGDDQIQDTNVYYVAPTVEIAEALQIKGYDSLIGFNPDYSGPLTKRAGGGTYPVLSQSGGTIAWCAMSSFRCTVQLLEVTP